MKRIKLMKKVNPNPVEWGQPESKYITPSHKSPNTSAATQAEHQQARLRPLGSAALRPVSWRWKAHPERGEQLALVAQEVEPVLPELVSTDKDAEQIKGLNYVGLVPVLVNAIQEQQAQIQKQAHEINRLQQHEKQQSKQQRDEISRLKQLVCLDHPKAVLCRQAP